MNFNEMFRSDEQPLEKLIDSVGFGAIFRTIGCVGDSLSSGELETINEDGSHKFDDRYEYSWGQFLGREIGSKVYNFSRGGMTAMNYCNYFAEDNGYWGEDKACDAYIIALGVNDLYHAMVEDKLIDFGSIDDVDPENYDNNKKTFAGYFGKIISRYKKISPKAKFFLMTMPDSNRNDPEGKGEMHQKLMHELAEKFDNTYVMDFRRYAPVYDDEFKKRFYLNGHMNACGYMLTAMMVKTYLDYIIRHNIEDFRLVGVR